MKRDLVYVTDMGGRYHTFETCHGITGGQRGASAQHLSVGLIRKVRLEEVQYRLKPCQLCSGLPHANRADANGAWIAEAADRAGLLGDGCSVSGDSPRPRIRIVLRDPSELYSNPAVAKLLKDIYKQFGGSLTLEVVDEPGWRLAVTKWEAFGMANGQMLTEHAMEISPARLGRLVSSGGSLGDAFKLPEPVKSPN